MTDQPKNGVERALGRIEGRLDAVEKKLAEPVECVQGALVMQKLDYLTASVRAAGEISNENKTKIDNTRNMTNEHHKTITDHTFLIDDLIENKENKTRKLVALVGAVAMVVSAAISAIVSAVL